MRVVIFWAMCHHSLGHKKGALKTYYMDGSDGLEITGVDFLPRLTGIKTGYSLS